MGVVVNWKVNQIWKGGKKIKLAVPNSRLVTQIFLFDPTIWVELN